MTSNTTDTSSFPIKDYARKLYWAVYAQTPAGRRDKRILTHPDVQAGLADVEPGRLHTWQEVFGDEQ